MKRILSQEWQNAFVFFKHEEEAGKGPDMATRFRDIAGNITPCKRNDTSRTKFIEKNGDYVQTKAKLRRESMATSTGVQLAQNIRQKIEELKKICEGVDESTASRSPAGRWSPKEILSHLWGPDGSSHLPHVSGFSRPGYSPH